MEHFAYKKRDLKVALLGASGIGKVHARIFHSLGAEIYGILGTSQQSVTKTADILMDDYGIKPKVFVTLQNILAEPIDAVCICTPPHLHFEQILESFNKGLPVFCEKPLFWDRNISLSQVYSRLEQLKFHPQRRFFMNAPNVFFLDEIRERVKAIKKISKIKFSFHTNGEHKGINIGIDLLTHGLSIIFNFLGIHELNSFKTKVMKSQYICHFTYANCNVEFDFREDPFGSKLFEFDIDGHIFTRIQEGTGSTYKLYFLDSQTNEKIEVYDPFSQSIYAFIQYCKAGAPIACDQFDEAEMIMTLMAEKLLTT